MGSASIDGLLVQLTDTVPNTLVVARPSVWGPVVLCHVHIGAREHPSASICTRFAPHLHVVARALQLFGSVTVTAMHCRRLRAARDAYRILRRHVVSSIYEFFAHATLPRSPVHLPRDVRDEVLRLVLPPAA